MFSELRNRAYCEDLTKTDKPIGKYNRPEIGKGML